MLNRLRLNKTNILEYYVMAQLFVGLPLIAAIYFDWRAALTTFVVTQIIIGCLAMRPQAEMVEDK